MFKEIHCQDFMALANGVKFCFEMHKCIPVLLSLKLSFRVSPILVDDTLEGNCEIRDKHNPEWFGCMKYSMPQYPLYRNISSFQLNEKI